MNLVLPLPTHTQQGQRMALSNYHHPIQNNIENFYYEHLDEEYLSDPIQFLGPFFPKKDSIERIVAIISTNLSRKESISESIELIVDRITQLEKSKSLFTKDTFTLLAWIISIRELILKDKIPLSSNSFLSRFPSISHQSITALELLYLMRFERAMKYFKSAKIDFYKFKDLILRVGQYFEWNSNSFNLPKNIQGNIDILRMHIYYFYENLKTNQYGSPQFPKANEKIPSLSSLSLPQPAVVTPMQPPLKKQKLHRPPGKPPGPDRVERNLYPNWKIADRPMIAAHYDEYLDQLHSLDEIDQFADRIFQVCWE